MRSVKPAAAAMPPFDRDPPPAARKPQMPTLAKTVSRAPVTPKITSRTIAPPLSPRQTVTVATTPLPRRAQQRPGSASRSDVAPGSGGGGGGNGSSSGIVDFASPVPAFLSSNVTPRSGSRQNRVNSASSTPNGTPNPDRSDSWEPRTGLGLLAGSGSASLDERLRQTTPTFTPPPSSSDAPAAAAAAAARESKFFFASEAKQAVQQQAPSKPPAPPQKSPAFFYANGETIGAAAAAAAAAAAVSASTPSPSPFTAVLGTPVAATATDSLASKFIYANGTPDLQPSLISTFSSPAGPGSTISVASRAPNRPGAPGPPTSHTSPRPPSPIKMPPAFAPKSGAQLVLNRGAMTSAPQLAPISTTPRHLNSESSSRTNPHSRNGSLSIAEPPAVSRLLSSLPGSGASSPSLASNPATGLASILQATQDLAESDDGPLYSELHSPTKSGSQQDQLDELVLNARRERKVQDLQITNASLEAINRTLERQLRKQKAELRQFRRLSRSGRLSLTSVRIASGSTVEGPLNDPSRALSDLSEEDGSEPEDEDDENYNDDDETDLSDAESGSGSSDLSPSLMSKRDAKHRKQDEKRLQLDLSKHRELLVDSQKINQSLKRCLGWTEELIKEGRKALAFQVRVSEVEIGGRVLAPVDEDESDKEGEGAGGRPNQQDDDTVRLGAALEAPSAWDKEPQDRDSGIELPVDGG